MAAAAIFCAASAQAAGHHYDHIEFYSNFGNPVGFRNPLATRPSTILLAEDGSQALSDLHWKGWGTETAVGTGIWGADSCSPSCANGKWNRHPASITLSDPGRVLGHVVYRCYRLRPAHPKQDVWPAHQCLVDQGGAYEYNPVRQN